MAWRRVPEGPDDNIGLFKIYSFGYSHFSQTISAKSWHLYTFHLHLYNIVLNTNSFAMAQHFVKNIFVPMS